MKQPSYLSPLRLLLKPVHRLLNLGGRFRRLGGEKRGRRVKEPVLQAGPADVRAELGAQHCHRHRRRRGLRNPEVRLVLNRVVKQSRRLVRRFPRHRAPVPRAHPAGAERPPGRVRRHAGRLPVQDHGGVEGGGRVDRERECYCVILITITPEPEMDGSVREYDPPVLSGLLRSHPWRWHLRGCHRSLLSHCEMSFSCFKVTFVKRGLNLIMPA